ncbi:adhesion G protein-coupled receptor G3 [Engraulis encrasicolus]|uniref:adhesion G protein-coupled receptor G3 n=1 Tax=Engraulis encrasicolus TaxID=184585 RepID=UPI002FD11752
MGDRPAASVSIGEIKGVMVKPKDEDDLKQLTFGSADTGLNIIQDESASNQLPLSVTVSKEAYQKSYQKKKNETIVGVFRFPNMTVGGNLTALTNKVYAIEMGTNISDLSEPIQLKFNMKIPGRRNLSCQSWDGNGSEPNWTEEGCITTQFDDQIVCECSHLTFFAVLMSPPGEEPISASDLGTLTYISYIGCGVSVFFLGIALFMFFCIRKAKASNATHILLHLMVALFLLNLTFLTNEWVANLGIDVACKIMAAAMHYSMLSSFSWFAVEAFHLCLQMTKYSAVSIPHYKLKLSIVGWAPPAIVVLVIFILEKYSLLTIPAANGTEAKLCWIVDSTVHYAVNIGYYSIVFLFTFVIFVVMLRWLCYMRSSSKVKGQKSSSTRSSDVITIMGLCCTLGVAWSFAFFSHGALRLPSYYIFSILNSLQGLFLFIYYYNTSKLIGDGGTSSNSTSSTDTSTSKLGFHNPYENE